MENKLSYFLDFHRNVARSIFNKQRLVVPEPRMGSCRETIAASYDFKISKRYADEWSSLFQKNCSPQYTPFSYYWPWTIQGLVEKLLPKLGVNLKNYLHVGQNIEFLGRFVPDGNTRYTNWNTIVDLCALPKSRMAIVSESSVHDNSGRMILRSRDYSIVLNMSALDMDHLSRATHCNQEDVTILANGLRTQRPRLKDSANGYRGRFYCQDEMGIRFGLVSGALNTTHTFKRISPLFGHKQPFLQGMCTGNIILALLSEKFGTNLRQFEVYFSSKLFLPQNVELVFDENRFELFDETNNLVAFGSHALHN